MKRALLFYVLVFVLPALPLFGAQGCDRCKDLPFLFPELMQQEYLRDQFESYIKQSYYPPTVGQIYRNVEVRFNDTLRDTIAGLSKQCQWEGSARTLKPDGTRVVPTGEQIEELKNNTRKVAGALRKGTG